MTNNEIAIARVCHEANRAYCASLGDPSQPKWDEAPQWQRDSAIAGVRFHIANPDAGPSGSHESWLAQKRAEGWAYGPVKDPGKKEHPCFLPYEQLPREQQAKDFIFTAIVHAMHSQAISVDLTPCQSSQISAWGYHAPSRTLALKFASNGKVYHYADVPSEIAEGFVKAESIGKYFGAHVRGKFAHSVPAVETKGE